MAKLIDVPANQDDPAFLYLNLRPNEKINLIIRHHWAAFLGTLVIVLFMAIFPLAVIGALNLAFHGGLSGYRQVIIVVFSSYYIFLLTFLFGSWINFYYDIIFITDQRIINVAQEGLLARKTSELSMKQVEDVTAEVNGFIRTFFNYGVLIVETAGEGSYDNPRQRGMEGYFTIIDVPDPNRIARVISELHRAADADT